MSVNRSGTVSGEELTALLKKAWDPVLQYMSQQKPVNLALLSTASLVHNQSNSHAVLCRAIVSAFKTSQVFSDIWQKQKASDQLFCVIFDKYTFFRTKCVQ